MDSKRRLNLSTKILVTTLLTGAATLASAVTLTRAVGVVNGGTNNGTGDLGSSLRYW